MKKLAFLLVWLLIVPCSASVGPQWKQMNGWEQYFDKAKVKGTFLFYDPQKNQYLVFDRKRAETAFIPASTFKIFNSLVALDTSAVRDENEILKWDGKDYGSAQANKDQSMRSAYKASVVWFYQEMARRAGTEKMQSFINRAGYGNKNITGGIDRFWLDGGLRTSALEQVDFLFRLQQNKLPFSRKTIELVKDVMVYEKTDRYIMRAKTGWAMRLTPQLGWFVGYVERGGRVYVFALNIDIATPEDGRSRISIAKSILRELKVIE